MHFCIIYTWKSILSTLYIMPHAAGALFVKGLHFSTKNAHLLNWCSFKICMASHIKFTKSILAEDKNNKNQMPHFLLSISISLCSFFSKVGCWHFYNHQSFSKVILNTLAEKTFVLWKRKLFFRTISNHYVISHFCLTTLFCLPF
jgi:hypothetical protein